MRGLETKAEMKEEANTQSEVSKKFECEVVFTHIPICLLTSSKARQNHRK